MLVVERPSRFSKANGSASLGVKLLLDEIADSDVEDALEVSGRRTKAKAVQDMERLLAIRERRRGGRACRARGTGRSRGARPEKSGCE
jgi:hypothetical protein